MPIPAPEVTIGDDPGFEAFCRERAAQWWLIWFACVAIVAIGWRVKQHQLTYSRLSTAEWQRSCEPLKAIEAEIATARQRWEAIQSRERLVADLTPNGSAVQWLSGIGRAAAQHVVIDEVRCTLNDRPQLRIHGIGRDDAAARDFIAALKSSDVFAGVALLTMEDAERPTREARAFTAQGQLQ